MQGDCLIVYPQTNSGIEQQRMVVIVTGYALLASHNMTSYLRLQTNVLVKFVDAIYILFHTRSS